MLLARRQAKFDERDEVCGPGVPVCGTMGLAARSRCCPGGVRPLRSASWPCAVGHTCRACDACCPVHDRECALPALARRSCPPGMQSSRRRLRISCLRAASSPAGARPWSPPSTRSWRRSSLSKRRSPRSSCGGRGGAGGGWWLCMRDQTAGGGPREAGAPAGGRLRQCCPPRILPASRRRPPAPAVSHATPCLSKGVARPSATISSRSKVKRPKKPVPGADARSSEDDQGSSGEEDEVRMRSHAPSACLGPGTPIHRPPLRPQRG